MFNFKREPFVYLPFRDIEFFDLSCEHCISLLEKLDLQYQSIVSTATTINEKMPFADRETYKECFGYVDSFIECYAKLVKAIKLSIGEDVGTVKSKQTIFDTSRYNPNASLQETIIHGLRNTAQHFEERLQDFGSQVDPFLKLHYQGVHMYWTIVFGKGGV